MISHSEKKEVEIAYFGLLEEFQNKKLGSYLLSQAIKKSFERKLYRVWVHTCSLDHKNALNNYIARGMKIFKTETVKFSFEIGSLNKSFQLLIYFNRRKISNIRF